MVPPSHAQRWTRRRANRKLAFSVRLEHLLKAAKVKGQLVRAYSYKHVQPPPEDQAWVEEKLALLAKQGLVDAPRTKGSKAAASPAAETKARPAAGKWFDQLLKRAAPKKKPARVDFAGVEKKQKLKLPDNYKKFITAVGPSSFEDVNGAEGFTAKVLPPAKLDFRSYRRGRWKKLGIEDAQVDGVMFAETGHGDVFVFDVSAAPDKAGASDYPVFWYDHEQNTVGPYASNFAECIKRFDRGE